MIIPLKIKMIMEIIMKMITKFIMENIIEMTVKMTMESEMEMIVWKCYWSGSVRSIFSVGFLIFPIIFSVCLLLNIMYIVCVWCTYNT